MKPKIKKSDLLYSGFFDLRQDILEREDGQTHPFTTLVIGVDSVVVLAQTTEGLWILNKEYRHATGKVLLGPPGGRLDKGEDPIVGGQRELLEETGYYSDKIEIIGCSHPFPGVCDQKIYYVWAKNSQKRGAQKLDPFEFIQTELKTDEELRKEIRNGSDVDGNLCIALWYKEAFC